MTKFKIKNGACVIPEGTKMIGHKEFFECDDLKEVVIPESVETINTYAFLGCTSLTKITLPDSVDTIECWDPSGVSRITMSKPFNSLIDLLVNGGFRVQMKEDRWHRWD
ncbi:MAG: leucine-rich repeat protein [Bacteroidales bacterium]|nr:leucine-rich repeat protein [Bacteroidales bacterium]